MRRFAALGLMLAACAAPQEPATLPDVSIPLRNPTAPVASQADATLDRLQGGWQVVAGAGLAPGTPIRIEGNALVLDGVALALTEAGQGRFAVGPDMIWVHWLDIDSRTAVLGDPNGTRVWIMDRTGRPGERLTAAKEILDWYGYDLGRIDGV